MPAGRPTEYRSEFPEQAYKLCLLGAIDRELSDFFGVSESTLNLWKLEYPEFSESLKAGKRDADANVANRLYQRAMGYSHDAVKIFMPAGASEPVYAKYVEHYAPDTTACIFWLKNRRPDLWRDVQAREHTGKDGGPIETAGLTPEERARRAVAMVDEAFGTTATFGTDGER